MKTPIPVGVDVLIDPLHTKTAPDVLNPARFGAYFTH